ncbi:MAG: hypothetical protein CUN54_05705 [Phototrophicales bacterium]|nr:MAG: hypothetical protein CUN54_05705 [Phototrophicales bacterium]
MRRLIAFLLFVFVFVVMAVAVVWFVFVRQTVADIVCLQQTRPTLSGEAHVHDGGRFLIHYTLTGQDATTAEFVAQVAAALYRIWDVQIAQQDWDEPAPDCGEGGDNRLDVYLMDTIGRQGVFGYTQPQSLISSDPEMLIPDDASAYSYLVLDNDFSTRALPLESMRSTAAHEFNHIVQFNYVRSSETLPFSEASATWQEIQTFPENDFISSFTVDLFTTLDECPGQFGAGFRPYGEWLLMDSLAQDYGASVVRRLWEAMTEGEGMMAFYTLARRLNVSPQEIVQRFAVRNLLLDYALAPRFTAQIPLEATLTDFGNLSPLRDGVQQLGVDYVHIANRRRYTFALEQDHFSLYVVGINQGANRATVYHLGRGGTVDTTAFDWAYLLVFNTATFDHPNNCVTTNWRVVVSDGRRNPLTPALDEVWDATNFIPVQ